MIIKDNTFYSENEYGYTKTISSENVKDYSEFITNVKKLCCYLDGCWSINIISIFSREYDKFYVEIKANYKHKIFAKYRPQKIKYDVALSILDGTREDDFLEKALKELPPENHMKRHIHIFINRSDNLQIISKNKKY
jgi:hypothetical protein